jgi:hypothetical protein
MAVPFIDVKALARRIPDGALLAIGGACRILEGRRPRLDGAGETRTRRV